MAVPDGMFKGISRVMAAAPALGPGQEQLWGPGKGLGRMGQSLGGNASGDPSTPEYWEAQAQKAAQSGDMAAARQYQNQAAQMRENTRQRGRQDASDARAVRGEQRTEEQIRKQDAAARKEARERVNKKHAVNDAELQEMQDRAALLKEAGQQGYGDLVRASRGMSNEQISAELLRRNKESRDAASDAAGEANPFLEQQISTIEEMRKQYEDDPAVTRIIDAQLKRVRANGKFDTAMTAITTALKDKAPEMGVVATADETLQISDLAAEIAPNSFGQLSDADKFRVATIVKNRQRNNPDVEVDTIVKQLATEYEVAGGDSAWLPDAFEADVLNRKSLSDDELLNMY